nr:dihydroneopterin aldolase family protein [Candidatus Sigynarchaeum springense]MDO8119120.1 dihydroneopterin aldolase family protein [Candidatus Sigynarchaeota archaeon]
MTGKEQKSVDQYFDVSITDRERACFEAGIKLGAIFHSIIGMPVVNNEEVMRKVEDGVIASFKSQPFVRDLRFRINVDSGKQYTKRHEFDYTLIKEHMIDLEIDLVYKQTHITGKIQWIPELGYPLMFLKEIK